MCLLAQHGWAGEYQISCSFARASGMDQECAKMGAKTMHSCYIGRRTGMQVCPPITQPKECRQLCLLCCTIGHFNSMQCSLVCNPHHGTPCAARPSLDTATHKLAPKVCRAGSPCLGQMPTSSTSACLSQGNPNLGSLPCIGRIPSSMVRDLRRRCLVQRGVNLPPIVIARSERRLRATKQSPFGDGSFPA